MYTIKYGHICLLSPPASVSIFPSLNFMLFCYSEIIFDNPLSLVKAAHMCTPMRPSKSLEKLPEDISSIKNDSLPSSYPLPIAP